MRRGTDRTARRLMGLGLATAISSSLGGCVHSYSDQAETVKERLIGIPGRSLRGCIGAPTDVRIEGDTEYLIYRWLLDSREEPARQTTREEMEEMREKSLSARSVGPRPGTCELVFEVREGRVSDVAADGRTAAGLNWNAGCALLARRCLPRS